MADPGSMIPEDVVAAILAHFPEEEFVADTTRLQEAFRRLKGSRPSLLAALSFDGAAILAKSEDLTGALDSLGKARYLRRENPDLCKYRVARSKLREYYRSFLKDLLDDAGLTEREIKEGASELSEIVRGLANSSVEELAQR